MRLKINNYYRSACRSRRQIPRLLLLLVISLLLSAVSSSLQAPDFQTAWVKTVVASDTFTGKVVGVSDGDTISVMRGSRAVKVRLHGIDCPEKKQPYGTRAKQFTSDLAFGKEVTIRIQTTDRYGRTVGVVILPEIGSVPFLKIHPKDLSERDHN